MVLSELFRDLNYDSSILLFRDLNYDISQLNWRPLYVCTVIQQIQKKLLSGNVLNIGILTLSVENVVRASFQIFRSLFPQFLNVLWEVFYVCKDCSCRS